MQVEFFSTTKFGRSLQVWQQFLLLIQSVEMTGKNLTMPLTNECLKKTLELAELMLQVADAGDVARQDVGCGVLYGVLRDSAYRIKKLAEAEREAHIKKGGWENFD